MLKCIQTKLREWKYSVFDSFPCEPPCIRINLIQLKSIHWFNDSWFSKERDDIRYILFDISFYFTIHFTVFAMIDRSWGVSDIYGYVLVLVDHNQGYRQEYIRVYKDLFDSMRVDLRQYLSEFWAKFEKFFRSRRFDDFNLFTC